MLAEFLQATRAVNSRSRQNCYDLGIIRVFHNGLLSSSIVIVVVEIATIVSLAPGPRPLEASTVCIQPMVYNQLFVVR